MMRTSLLMPLLLSLAALTACGGTSDAAIEKAESERAAAAEHYGDSKWAVTGPTEENKKEKPAEPVEKDVTGDGPQGN